MLQLPPRRGRAFGRQQNIPAGPHSPALVALSPRPAAPVCWGVTARAGHSLALAPSPSPLRVFQTLKLIHLGAFLVAPSDGNAESFPQPPDKDQAGDGGPDAPLVFLPGCHHPVRSRGTEGPQRSPQQHKPLSGVSWGARAPPSQPGKAAGPAGSGEHLPPTRPSHAAISGAVEIT